MAVRIVDILRNYKSIASDGYRYGLEFMGSGRNKLHEEEEKDEMFMARYVNLLDTAFQNFSSELAAFHTDKDPIRRARKSLRGKMVEDIKMIMRDIDYNTVGRGTGRKGSRRTIESKDRSPTRNDKTAPPGGRRAHPNK
jgi:hypothetical protein